MAEYSTQQPHATRSGTTQEFVLEPQPDGEVLLKFCHSGWEHGGDHCYFCNTTSDICPSA